MVVVKGFAQIRNQKRQQNLCQAKNWAGGTGKIARLIKKIGDMPHLAWHITCFLCLPGFWKRLRRLQRAGFAEMPCIQYLQRFSGPCIVAATLL
jgi:hypothetical protein